MQDSRDFVADSFAVELYRSNHEIERFNKLSRWEKIFAIAPSPRNLKSEDSSTGLGQIFAKTAVNAYNAAIDRDDIIGQKINYDDWHEREKVWTELRNDNEKNIFYVGLVLKYEAEKFRLNISSATNSEIEKILARYNGFNEAAAEYGRETKQYYEVFRNFNK